MTGNASIHEFILKTISNLRRAENTSRTYLRAMELFVQYLKEEYEIEPSAPTSEMSVDMFIEYPDWLATKPFGKSTRMVYLSGVKRLFRACTKSHIIAPTQAEVMTFEDGIKELNRERESRLPKTPKIAHVQKMLDTVSTGIQDILELRNDALLHILAHTGMRVGEVVGLKVGNLDIEKMRIQVIGKGNKERYVLFSEEVKHKLAAYLVFRKWHEDDSPLFARHDRAAQGSREHITTDTVRDVVSEVAEKCGVENITPHSFRHYFVTRMVQEVGVDQARELAGHSTPAITAKYTHYTNDDLRGDYDKVFG